MHTDTRIDRIKTLVEQKLSCSAHNLDHVQRVYKLAMMLAEEEKDVDKEILIPAVLLHDIARIEESEDTTGKTDHAALGGIRAEEILSALAYEDEAIERIKHCITTHRFRTGNAPKTIEAKILYDADKLDAIGAIGIARCFMLGGQHGQSLSQNNASNNSSENGRIKDLSKHSPIVEYEVKLKKIPEKLFTKKAKEIGYERLKIMDNFFNNLILEMEGVK